MSSGVLGVGLETRIQKNIIVKKVPVFNKISSVGTCPSDITNTTGFIT